MKFEYRVYEIKADRILKNITFLPVRTGGADVLQPKRVGGLFSTRRNTKNRGRFFVGRSFFFAFFFGFSVDGGRGPLLVRTGGADFLRPEKFENLW